MKLISEISGWIRVLFCPECWSQQKLYSKIWNARLVHLLETDYFKPDGDHTHKIGNAVVWTTNHPYASFTVEINGVKFRPRRITILRAMDKLMESERAAEQKRLDDAGSELVRRIMDGKL